MDHESIDPLDHYARYCARARTLAAESLDKMTAERVANNELGRTDPDALKAKLDASMPDTICCFCHSMFRGFGHNPEPLLEDGTACYDCNLTIVMRARYEEVRAQWHLEQRDLKPESDI